jgi:hypothetical protein
MRPRRQVPRDSNLGYEQQQLALRLYFVITQSRSHMNGTAKATPDAATAGQTTRISSFQPANHFKNLNLDPNSFSFLLTILLQLC